MSDSTDTNLLGWVLAGVASIIATLSSLIVAGTRKIIGDYRDEIKELKAHAADCESKHFQLNGKCAALEQQVNFLTEKVQKIESDGTHYSQERERHS